jgi:hypothetical protein
MARSSKLSLAARQVFFLAALPATVLCQSLTESVTTGETLRIAPADTVVFARKDVRSTLSCSVTPFSPFLGFDLRFHADYEVDMPLKELSGTGNGLTVLLRVERIGALDDPAYFFQTLVIPEIGKDARGSVRFEGGIDIGDGNYHFQLLIRDGRERVCSYRWDASASLPYRDRSMKLAVPPGHAEGSDRRLFRADAPVDRMGRGEGLKVRILVNFAPQQASAAALSDVDLVGLVSILRNISRDPRISEFSVIAFSTNEQRIFYRKENADQIDFPALGKGVASLKPGVIEYRKLIDRHSEAEFLHRLIETELDSDGADAIVFAGPKVMLEEEVPVRNVNRSAQRPVFYLNYNLAPAALPWRDAIGKVVKRLGGAEYQISCPHELWSSWNDIVERTINRKLAGPFREAPGAEDTDAFRKVFVR